MNPPPPPARFDAVRKPFSLPLLLAIAALHLAVFYGLARALAPDLTAAVEQTVVSAFTLEAPPPPPPPPEPDAAEEGAAGDPGREETAKPVAAPPPERVLRKETPLPRVASTGTANRSGAADAGEGTGAAGSGDGTGSGNAGSGRGSGLASKPVHIAGEINNARDYPVPEAGRAARRGTEVIVRVIVGVDGRALSPTHCVKNGRLYRYYVAQRVLKGDAAGDDSIVRRVPAAEIEAAVVDQVRALLRQPDVVVGTWLAARREAPDLTECEVRDALHRLDPMWAELFPAEQARIARALVERVVVGPAGADIRLRVEGLAGLVRDLTAIAPEVVRGAT